MVCTCCKVMSNELSVLSTLKIFRSSFDTITTLNNGRPAEFACPLQIFISNVTVDSKTVILIRTNSLKFILMMKYLKRILSLAVVSLLLSHRQINAGDDSREAADFQAVNSYLTSRLPIKLEESSVIPLLNDAIDTIESFGLENFDVLSHVNSSPKDKFYALTQGNPKIILEILKNLVQSSKSCDQESLNFLTLIQKDQTFDEQFLNLYASKILAKCTEFAVSSLVQSLERSFGKSDASLPANLIDIVNAIEARKKTQHRTKGGAIVLKDPNPLISPEEQLRHLKRVNFGENELQNFTIAFNQLFNRLVLETMDKEDAKNKTLVISKLKLFLNYYLVAPCSDLVRRSREAASNIEDSRRYLPDMKREITKYRSTDPSFDQNLEMCRICRELMEKQDTIWKLLSKMH